MACVVEGVLAEGRLEVAESPAQPLFASGPVAGGHNLESPTGVLPVLFGLRAPWVLQHVQQLVQGCLMLLQKDDDIRHSPVEQRAQSCESVPHIDLQTADDVRYPVDASAHSRELLCKLLAQPTHGRCELRRQRRGSLLPLLCDLAKVVHLLAL